jgi:16S rRNA (guanine527-N7)-methyltransferase
LTKNLFRKNKKQPQGIIYLTGGDLTEEIASFHHIITYCISDIYEETYFETKKMIFLEKKFFN